jgi:uncharacterized protein
MDRYIRVENSTRGTTLAARCRVARSIIERIFGLHLLPRLQPGEGLLLTGATTIDTTFMGYPIDLVFVDRSLRVTRLVPDVVPWRMVLRTRGGRDCIELPGGALQGTETEPGDQLSFVPVE